MDNKHIPEWTRGLNCGIMVCDAKGDIIYMNERSLASKGNLLGTNILGCHNERSQDIIRRMLDTGGDNAYTIEKDGIRKFIYQSAWTDGGRVAGLAEIIVELPAELPHYVRN